MELSQNCRCIYTYHKTATNRETAEKNTEVVRLFAKCPNCKAQLGLIRGRYIESYEDNKPDIVFSELAKQINTEQKSIFEKKIREFVEDIKKKPDMDSGNSVASKVRLSLDSLKQYILYLIHMESEIYLLSERLAVLQLKAADNKQSDFRTRLSITNHAELEIAKKTDKLTSEIQKRRNEIKNADREIRFALKHKTDSYGLVPPPELKIELPDKPIPPIKPEIVLPLAPKEPEYRQPSLFNKRKISEENARIREEYEIELKKYQHQCEIVRAAQQIYLPRNY